MVQCSRWVVCHPGWKAYNLTSSDKGSAKSNITSRNMRTFMYNFTKNHSLGFRSPLQSWHVLSSTNKNFLERKTKQKNKVRRRGLQVKREIKAETREAENHTAIILLLAALALQGSPSVEETASGTSPFRRESSPAVGTRHSPRLSPQGAPGSAVLGHFAWFLARCGPSTNRFSECNR